MWVILLVSAALAAVSPSSAPALGRDHPIAAGSRAPTYLDGSDWRLVNLARNHSAEPLQATIPGDILTDLQRGGLVKDPYFNSTWRDPAFIDAWNVGTWVYTKRFPSVAGLTKDGSAATLLLVLDGVRMGAMVHLNGKFLGNVTDQFLRYTFVLQTSDLAATSVNVLTLAFGNSLGIPTGGRFTFSDQIDWAPVMLTKDPTTSGTRAGTGERSTFGFGVWKSVYLLPVPTSTAAITQFVPHTFYAGGHPTKLLTDGDHKGFMIKATVEFWLEQHQQDGVVSVKGNWPNAEQTRINVTLHAGHNSVTLTIPASETIGVRLWNPRGHGDQVMYTINATYLPTPARTTFATATEPTTASRRRVTLQNRVLFLGPKVCPFR